MKLKAWLVVIALIIILPVAWYLISPAFKVVEVNDASPIIKDNMEKMDAETKAEFEKQVKEMSNKVIEKQDEMPSSSLIAQGEFKPRAHEVEGTALLIDDGSSKVLRFEGFETINGPELHIYLSSELGGDDFIDLGIIKATKGNVNYDVPENVDTDKYNKVLVWCKPFKVLFSYAELE